MKKIDELKKRCDVFLENAFIEKDEKKISIYETIRNILKEKNSFSLISADVAFNILMDLGYTKREIKGVYETLLKECEN